MSQASKLTVASALLAITATTASAEPRQNDLAAPTLHRRHDPLATTERWGGGVRVTGLSGVGALPGVNYGTEVAVQLRHDEVFAELALGRWKPEESYRVIDTDDRVDLKLDLWTLRAGWSSMTMPLRGWLLVELGEIAGARGMPGVVSRMMTGDTPPQRQWRAAGGGFGVAWPMSDQARLFGSMEIAIPLNREPILLDRRGMYEPDPLVARTTVGIEVGWR